MSNLLAKQANRPWHKAYACGCEPHLPGHRVGDQVKLYRASRAERNDLGVATFHLVTNPATS